MKSLTFGPQAPLRTATPASGRGERAALIDRVAAAAVRNRLGGLAHGVLHLVDGDSSATYGARTASCPLEVTLRVHDSRFYSDMALGGSVGAGQAYMQGWWSVDDLTALVRILLHNRAVLDGMESGWARLAAPARKALH